MLPVLFAEDVGAHEVPEGVAEAVLHAVAEVAAAAKSWILGARAGAGWNSRDRP